MKKSILSLVIGLIILVFCIANVLAVSSVNLKITGTIGNYSSDVRLRTDSNANTGFDAYDLQIPSTPTSGTSAASFYSSITSGNVKIDSWNPVERDVTLVYDVPPGQSGNVAFSWNQVTGTNYKAYFSITGSVTDLDMSSASSYTYSASSDSDIYVTIEIEDYPTSSTPASTSSSGGGGGGGAVTQPAINIRLNNTGKILFDAGIVITDAFKSINIGDKMESTINLIPMGKDPYLDVTLKYNIKGADGRDTGIKESETILVEEQKNFKKEFATQSLAPGDYILELELVYETTPGKFAVATASSHFSVNSESGEGLATLSSSLGILGNYKFIIAGLFLGTIILIGIILIVIGRTKKMIKKRR